MGASRGAGQSARQKRVSAASGVSPSAPENDTTVAAAISRSPGSEGLPPLRKSNQREMPAASTVQKQSVAGAYFYLSIGEGEAAPPVGRM